MDEEERIVEKCKTTMLVFWMFLLGWFIIVHYFAWLGVLASIERTWDMEPIQEHSEYPLRWWKGRLLDLEELIYLEEDKDTMKELLIGYTQAYVEIQILEIVMSIRWIPLRQPRRVYIHRERRGWLFCAHFSFNRDLITAIRSSFGKDFSRIISASSCVQFGWSFM